MLTRAKRSDEASEQILERSPERDEEQLNTERASNSFRLRNIVESALETAAGAMPSWRSSAVSVTDGADRTSPAGPSPRPSTHTSKEGTPTPLTRRRSTYNELVDSEAEDSRSTSSQDDHPVAQSRSSRGRPPTDPRLASRRRSDPCCADQRDLEGAKTTPSPVSANERRSPKTVSPLKRALRHFSDSQRVIHFDDSSLASLECNGLQQPAAVRATCSSSAASNGHVAAACLPAPAPASGSLSDRAGMKTPDPAAARGSVNGPGPRRPNAVATEAEPAAVMAAAGPADCGAGGPALGMNSSAWLPHRAMLKAASPLYNRLPSDDHSSHLPSELPMNDSAFDVADLPASKAAQGSTGHTPLHDGIASLSTIIGSGRTRATTQLPMGAQPAQAPAYATPTQRAAPSAGTNTLPQSRDSTLSTSSFRSDAWEASSAPASSTASMRRLDGGPPSTTAPDDIYDIFEPPDQDVAVSPSPVSPSSAWHVHDLELVKAMTGQQALDALEEGCMVRKKWVTRLLPEEARHAARSRRHLRCQLQGSSVTLLYQRQGLKGLLDNSEVSATVQRVEVSSGCWAADVDIRIHSSLGVLSIQAPSPTAFTLWTLGLNAALAASHSRSRAYILSRPLHTIPRDGMFTVRDPSGQHGSSTRHA